MGYWQVVIPEATVNLIANPSWETSTGNWTSSGLTTYVQVSTEQIFGAYSAHISGTVSTGARLYSANMTITAGETWTFSIYAKKTVSATSGQGGLKITWLTSSGGAISTSSTSLPGGNVTTWTRYTFTATPATSATQANVSITDDGITSGSTWHMWLDGAQFE